MQYPERVEKIRPYIRGDVLDVGCVQHTASNEESFSWLHQYLYELDNVNSVIGIDVLSEDVAELQERGYNVIKTDAESCTLEQSFDTVVAGELIEHLSNPGDFLDNMRDHLNDDGLFILTTPNTFNILRFLFLIKNGYVACNDEHTCWFDSKTLLQLTERHGFGLELIEKCTFREEGEFVDPVSKVIQTITPAGWTAETLIAVFSINKGV